MRMGEERQWLQVVLRNCPFYLILSFLSECVRWWLTSVFPKGHSMAHLHQNHGQLLKMKMPGSHSWVRISGDRPPNLRFNPISQVHPWSLKRVTHTPYDFLLFAVYTKIYIALLLYKTHLYTNTYISIISLFSHNILWVLLSQFY